MTFETFGFRCTVCGAQFNQLVRIRFPRCCGRQMLLLDSARFIENAFTSTDGNRPSPKSPESSGAVGETET